MVCKRCGSETKQPWMDYCSGCYSDLNKGKPGKNEGAIAREACLNTAVAFLGLRCSVKFGETDLTPERVISVAREFLAFVEEGGKA